MKYLPVFIGALLLGLVTHVYASDDASVKMPLPTGLSRDTQYIIYYIDQCISALEREVDKRFEQVDKRFEEVNKRFEDLITFLWMLTGIFTTLTAVVIGFAYWDRRTIIRQA